MNEILDYFKTDDGRIWFNRILSHLDKIDAIDHVIINRLIELFPEYKYSGEAYRVIWKKKNLLNHFGFDGKELDWDYTKPNASWTFNVDATDYFLDIIHGAFEYDTDIVCKIYKAEVVGFNLHKFFIDFKDNIFELSFRGIHILELEIAVSSYSGLVCIDRKILKS